jgi:hypothetical protein
MLQLNKESIDAHVDPIEPMVHKISPDSFIKRNYKAEYGHVFL